MTYFYFLKKQLFPFSIWLIGMAFGYWTGLYYESFYRTPRAVLILVSSVLILIFLVSFIRYKYQKEN